MSRGETKAAARPKSEISVFLILSSVVAVAAIGIATTSALSPGGLDRFGREFTSSAKLILKSWSSTIPGLEELSLKLGLQTKNESSPKDDSCSCRVKRLSGIVDDCCCEYETVDGLNREVLQPLLEELVKKPFFRYFKVRLWCDCPFWREDGMCHSRDCSVGECPDHEVPLPLKSGRNGGAPKAPVKDPPAKTDGPDVDPALSLSVVDRTVDSSDFLEWSEEDNPWTHDNEAANDESTYVDLVLNPERYTGYVGDSARRIWSAIYQESCFEDGDNDTCRERRVFYRLISGFHMSITVHVSTSFLHSNNSGEWGPHLEMFKWRVANFPDRLANLYFTYLFVLRAATKASDYLSFVSYDTGNPEEDKQTSALVRSLVASERLKAACPVPFDEATLWTGDEGPQLFHTLQQHFRNISAIMDCVGCERCRLWGKLEMLGLATALKILFSVGEQGTKCTIPLQRNEVTALVNTLWRFSEALKSTSEMMALLEQVPPPAPIASSPSLPANDQQIVGNTGS